MRHLVILCMVCFSFQWSISQESYTINGETFELKTEIEGKLDLLWNTIDGNYRYFIRTEDGTIIELKNTQGSDKNYNEEYKKTLRELTQLDTNKLKLRLYDLKSFLNGYNASADSNYTFEATDKSILMRLGVSGGITNNPFVGNPDNIKTPLFGAELEVLEANSSLRHAGFIQLRHALESDDFQYSTTEFSLGYRYRVINKSAFSIYGQVKLATLNLSNVTILDEDNMESDISDTAFDVPLIFGIGSDIKVGEKSYITIIYGELFSAFLDNQGNFSTDISVGYKFNL